MGENHRRGGCGPHIPDPHLTEKSPLPSKYRALVRAAGNGVILCALSILVGIGTGAIDTFFGFILDRLGAFRLAHPYWLLPFLPVAGVIIIGSYRRWGGDCFYAMDHVFHAAFGETARLPWRTIPFVMGSAWLTHLFGGSAGRVGVAIPIGSVLASHLHRFVPQERAMHVLLIAGMAAGFGGLFQAPVAGIFFAMEILASGRFENEAFLPALCASWGAYFTAFFLGMPRIALSFPNPLPFAPMEVVTMALCGALFGMIGGSFAWTMARARTWLAARIHSPYLRIAAAGAAVACLSMALHGGRYSGLSFALTAAAFTGGVMYAYDWAAKYILTILTRASGFQGGEVMPLLCIGASLGAVLAPVLGIPSFFMAACGAIGVLAGATNTLLAPIALGLELFGWDSMPFFFTVCIIAKTVNGNQCLYELQRKNPSFWQNMSSEK